MKTIGIIACSNARSENKHEAIEELAVFFNKQKIKTIFANYLYANQRSLLNNGQARAFELNKLYDNPNISDIYDVSGGDVANEVLDYLDYQKIKNSDKVFWGYSDLTTVINAIYSQTSKASVLYQICNLVDEDYGNLQRDRYLNQEDLFKPKFQMVQGTKIEGVVIGGNLRCFLKLAGTKYFPDVQAKVLLIEAKGGRVPQMLTYLSQLKSMGVFDKIKGILLGTFTTMEEEDLLPDIVTIVKSFVNQDMPIAKTDEIGHNHNAKAIWIGKEVKIS